MILDLDIAVLSGRSERDPLAVNVKLTTVQRFVFALPAGEGGGGGVTGRGGQEEGALEGPGRGVDGGGVVGVV